MTLLQQRLKSSSSFTLPKTRSRELLDRSLSRLKRRSRLPLRSKASLSSWTSTTLNLLKSWTRTVILSTNRWKRRLYKESHYSIISLKSNWTTLRAAFLMHKKHYCPYKTFLTLTSETFTIIWSEPWWPKWGWCILFQKRTRVNKINSHTLRLNPNWRSHGFCCWKTIGKAWLTKYLKTSI